MSAQQGECTGHSRDAHYSILFYLFSTLAWSLLLLFKWIDADADAD
jgi:hypothetical protein